MTIFFQPAANAQKNIREHSAASARGCYPPLTAAMITDEIWGLLYWDGSRLRVDETPFDGIGITSNFNNVIFAKFGSVVGFTHTGTSDDWDATDIKFDPRTTKTTTYTGIQYWSSQGWAEGYISTTVHTGTNVKTNGLGDICKLAGIRAVDVSTTNYDNTTWRLPTVADNNRFVGDSDTFSWDKTVTPRIITFSTGHSLPALGHRTGTGSSSTWGPWGTYALYWLSTPNDVDGNSLHCQIDLVSSPRVVTTLNGHAIRCVRQTP